MTTLAQNVRLRVVAVAIVLLLRPCVIFLSGQFLSSQSGRHARIEYIDGDVAIQHLLTNRKPISALHGATDCTSLNASSQKSLRWNPGFWAVVAQANSLRLTPPPVSIFASRAPPTPGA